LNPGEAAEAVYQCLLEMGEAGSNPVLELIPPDTSVVEQRHYPDPWLAFAGAPLRAYYHCHPQPTRIVGEHGHFHLFLEAEAGGWTHLGALSMDPQGQPRALFSTNRWVTDELWLSSAELGKLVFPSLPLDELSRVETWLMAMLHLLRPHFVALWEARDRRLTTIKASSAVEDILENREYYVLAQRPVDLLSAMQGALSTQTGRG